MNDATETAGKIVWFELPAADTKRATEFYGRLLGWQFQPFGGQDYHTTYEAGGAIYNAPGQKGLLAYFGVDEIESAIARVRELGGEAGEPEQAGVGRFAICKDDQGSRFGLHEPPRSA